MVPPLPRVEVTTDDALGLEVDALVVPVFRGGIETPGAQAALSALGFEDVPRDADFRGRVGELHRLAAPGLPCGQVVLVGLGRMDELGHEVVRRAAGAATRQLTDEAASVALTLPLVKPDAETVAAATEGALLGAYRYRAQRSAPEPPRLDAVSLVVPSSLESEARQATSRATVYARATCLARDLVNTPARDKSPQRFCELAADAVGAAVAVEVWDAERLERERCGGVLAVGRGSSRPPRMLILRYRPDHPVARVALVGKGIVFDSGGLSLKRPNAAMVSMKADMAGAAAVVATLSALHELGCSVEVIGICGVAENMPSGDAQRPSDVFRARNGTTVEVLNTDAEGRLVLADALSLAVEEDLDAVVDIATLTGAAARAVGKRASAAFSNDDDLLRRVLGAADAAGEPTWHLPLWEDLRENLDSDVADLNNLGEGDEAHASTAGLFLREFVADTPWVHLDIAGAGWAEKDRDHVGKGGTGAGVPTLLRWLSLPGI